MGIFLIGLISILDTIKSEQILFWSEKLSTLGSNLLSEKKLEGICFATGLFKIAPISLLRPRIDKLSGRFAVVLKSKIISFFIINC